MSEGFTPYRLAQLTFLLLARNIALEYAMRFKSSWWFPRMMYAG